MSAKTANGSGSPPSIFISYSHADEDWNDRVVTQLRALESEGHFDVWDDRQIAVGEDWYPEIEQALNEASVAILLISANFLTSRFIKGKEVPRLLKRRAEERLRVIPLILKPCVWKRINWLKGIQVRPKDGHPLSGGSEHEIEVELAELVTLVDDHLKALSAVSSPLDPSPESSPTNILQPRYQNESLRTVSQALEAAYERQETLLSAGQDSTAVTQEILKLKRQMRQGPQLKAGDFLWEGL
jgi:TIR domain